MAKTQLFLELESEIRAILEDQERFQIPQELFGKLDEHEMLLTSQSRHTEFLQLTDLHLALLIRVAPNRKEDLIFLDAAISRHSKDSSDILAILTTRNNLATGFLHFREFQRSHLVAFSLLKDLDLLASKDPSCCGVLMGKLQTDLSDSSKKVLKILVSVKLTLALSSVGNKLQQQLVTSNEIFRHLKEAHTIAWVGLKDSQLREKIEKIIKSMLQKNDDSKRDTNRAGDRTKSLENATRIQIVRNITGGVDPLEQIPGEFGFKSKVSRSPQLKQGQLGSRARYTKMVNFSTVNKSGSPINHEYKQMQSSLAYRKYGKNRDARLQPQPQEKSTIMRTSLQQQPKSPERSPANQSPTDTKPPEEYSVPEEHRGVMVKKSIFANAAEYQPHSRRFALPHHNEPRHSSESDRDNLTPQKSVPNVAGLRGHPSLTSVSPVNKVQRARKTRYSQFVFRTDSVFQPESQNRRAESYTQLCADNKPGKYASMGNFSRVPKGITIETRLDDRAASQSNISPESPLTNAEQMSVNHRPYFSKQMEGNHQVSNKPNQYRNSIQIRQPNQRPVEHTDRPRKGPNAQEDQNVESLTSDGEDEPSLNEEQPTREHLRETERRDTNTQQEIPGRVTLKDMRKHSQSVVGLPNEPADDPPPKNKSFTHRRQDKQVAVQFAGDNGSLSTINRNVSDAGNSYLFAVPDTRFEQRRAQKKDSLVNDWRKFPVVEENEISRSAQIGNSDAASVRATSKHNGKDVIANPKDRDQHLAEENTVMDNPGTDPSSMTDVLLQRGGDEDQIADPPLISKPSLLSQSNSQGKTQMYLQVHSREPNINISLEEHMQGRDDDEKKSFRLQFGNNVNLVEQSRDHLQPLGSHFSVLPSTQEPNISTDDLGVHRSKASRQSRKTSRASIQEVSRQPSVHRSPENNQHAMESRAELVEQTGSAFRIRDRPSQQNLAIIEDPKCRPLETKISKDSGGISETLGAPSLTLVTTPKPTLRVNNKPYLLLEDQTPVGRFHNQSKSPSFSNMLHMNSEPNPGMITVHSPQNTTELEILKREFQILKQKSQEQDILLGILKNKLQNQSPHESNSLFSLQNSEALPKPVPRRTIEISSPSAKLSQPAGGLELANTPSQSQLFQSAELVGSHATKNSSLNSIGVSSWNNTPGTDSKGTTQANMYTRPLNLKPSQFSMVKANMERDFNLVEKSPSNSVITDRRARSPMANQPVTKDSGELSVSKKAGDKPATKTIPAINSTRLELQRLEQNQKKELTVVANSPAWEDMSRSHQGGTQPSKLVHPRINNFKSSWTEPISIVKTYDLGLESEIVCISIKASLKHVPGAETSQLSFELMSYKSKKVVRPTSQSQLPSLSLFDGLTKVSPRVVDMSTDMMTITEGIFFKLMDTCDPEGLDFYPHVILVKNSLDHYMRLFVSRFLGVEIDENKKVIRPAIKKRPQTLLQVPNLKYQGGSFTVSLVHKNMLDFWVWIDSTVSRRPRGFKKRIEINFDRESFEKFFARSSFLENQNSLKQKFSQQSNPHTSLHLPGSSTALPSSGPVDSS